MNWDWDFSLEVYQYTFILYNIVILYFIKLLIHFILNSLFLCFSINKTVIFKRFYILQWNTVGYLINNNAQQWFPVQSNCWHKSDCCIVGKTDRDRENVVVSWLSHVSCVTCDKSPIPYSLFYSTCHLGWTLLLFYRNCVSIQYLLFNQFMKCCGIKYV